MRRRLAHIIPEWGLVEQKAESFDVQATQDFIKKSVSIIQKWFINDEKDENFVFTIFCLDYTLESMNLFLTSGFELELYHHTEYLYMYWYMDAISGMIRQHSDKLNIIFQTGSKQSKKKKQKPFTRDQIIRNKFVEIQNLLSRSLFRVKFKSFY